MRMRKIPTILITIFLFVSMTCVVAADNPTPPHMVYGYIKDDGNGVSGIDVELKIDGETEASTTTESDGYYKLKVNGINEGNILDLYVDGKDTSKDITYETGKVEQINHDGDYISGTGSGSDGGGGLGGAPSQEDTPEDNVVKVEIKNNVASANIDVVKKNQQVSVQIQSQDGEQTSFVDEISFKSKNDAQNVEISVVNHGNNKPEDVPSSSESDSETVHSYMEINHKNLDNDDIEDVSIKFRVEKSWLEENNKEPSSVGLKRYNNDNWDVLAVSQFDETDTHYIYKAQTPGFSHYSIYAEEDQTYSISEGSDDTSEDSSDETKQAEDDREGIPGLTIFVIVALIALVAVAAVTTLKRQQQK